MKNHIFRGVATALVTPFSNGRIDFSALGSIINEQISGGVDALVAVGTTGESATLSDDEKYDVIRFTVKETARRVPVIAGAGSNDTEHAVNLCRAAKEAGADAVLSVTPYYNKTSQRGLIAHYTRIAEASDLPVIVYNVPSRTGVDILPETYAILAAHPNIAAIKEAAGSISKLAQTMALAGDVPDVYIGNDDMIVPALSLGASGVISVASNVAPTEIKQICSLWFEGKTQDAARIFLKFVPLFRELFSDVNPVPVKAAMNILRKCSDEVRLPLVRMTESGRAALEKALLEAGVMPCGKDDS